MIKLTFFEGEALYLAPEQITAVYDDISATTIDCGAEKYSVEEKSEEVVRKIMDYKLAMVRYTTSSQIAYDCYSKNKQNPYTPPLDQVLILDKLAGLEQTP